MKKIQISLIILFCIIIIGISIYYINYINYKQKSQSSTNYPNILFPVLPSNNYYNEFSEYLKNNANVNDDCVDCLFNKMSKKYTYSDFKKFLYLSQHNDDPTIDLTQNNFANDLLGDTVCGCN